MVSGNIDPKSSENAKSEGRIDAIKQLIFGENMVEYDARFQELLETVEEKEKAMNAKMEKLKSELSSTINTLEKAHMRRMDQMVSDSEKAFAKFDDKKTDRRSLGKMLEQMGQKLQA